MQGINIPVKSWGATLADFKILYLFFRKIWTIWNNDKKIDACDFIFLGFDTHKGIAELSTCTKQCKMRNLQCRLLFPNYFSFKLTDCQTDSVPSGDFVEMQNVIDFGNQNGAEPCK